MKYTNPPYRIYREVGTPDDSYSEFLANAWSYHEVEEILDDLDRRYPEHYHFYECVL